MDQKQRRTHNLNIRVTPGLKADLQAIADKRIGSSVSQVSLEALVEYVKNHADPPDDFEMQVSAKLTKREHLARGRSQSGGTRSHGGKVTSLPPKTGGSTDEGER